MEHHGNPILRQLNIQFNTKACVHCLAECRHGVLRSLRCIVMQTSVGIKPFFKASRIGLMCHPGHDHEEIQNPHDQNTEHYNS